MRAAKNCRPTPRHNRAFRIGLCWRSFSRAGLMPRDEAIEAPALIRPEHRINIPSVSKMSGRSAGAYTSRAARSAAPQPLFIGLAGAALFRVRRQTLSRSDRSHMKQTMVQPPSTFLPRLAAPVCKIARQGGRPAGTSLLARPFPPTDWRRVFSFFGIMCLRQPCKRPAGAFVCVQKMGQSVKFINIYVVITVPFHKG